MLFKKTLKAAPAVALWMVALLGAHSAMAQVNLALPQTATNNPWATYSAEALGAASGGVYTIAHADVLTGTAALGALAGVINESNDIYVRVDVGGVLRLTGAPSAGITVGTRTPVTDNQTTPGTSGLTRDQHLIYVIDSADGSTGTEVVSVNLTDVAAVAGIGDGTMRIRAYDDIRDAVRASGDPLLDQEGILVKVVRCIAVRAVPQTSTATVVSGFTQFEGAVGVDDMQALAAMSVAIGCHRKPDGTFLQGDPDPSDTTGFESGVTAAGCETLQTGGDTTANVTPDLSEVNVATAGTGVSISGDPGFAFAKATSFNMMADCTDTGAGAIFPKLADGKNNLAGPASGTVMVGMTYLCVTVAPTNAERIEPGTYEADVNLAASNANMPFAPMGVSDATVGTIRHDGTSVSIPYLTSYDGYTQRIIIVNRNKADVAYKLTFHTEGDGTADPMYVEGMAMGSMTTVMKVADIVTLMNPTRASATLDIVSSPRMVDVSTTMVNKMDQSTDTVALHLGKRDMNNM